MNAASMLFSRRIRSAWMNKWVQLFTLYRNIWEISFVYARGQGFNSFTISIVRWNPSSQATKTDDCQRIKRGLVSALPRNYKAKHNVSIKQWQLECHWIQFRASEALVPEMLPRCRISFVFVNNWRPQIIARKPAVTI